MHRPQQPNTGRILAPISGLTSLRKLSLKIHVFWGVKLPVGYSIPTFRRIVLWVSYNRADLRCKEFGLSCSHLIFLFHCFNRFETEFLGCYEFFISVFCMWHIVALEFSPLLPTVLFLCHLFRSTMKMFYTHWFSDLILQTKWTCKLKWNEVINNRRLTYYEQCACVCVCGNRRSSTTICRCQKQYLS